MTDTIASIASKGCQGTGITEEIADRIADAEAGSLVCIVELSYSALHKKKGGKRKVELVIDHIEPATDGIADDYLREVQRAMYKNRALAGHVGTTTGGTEPTVGEVLATGERFKAHPFVPVSAGENDQPICDVCGLLEAAPIHSTQDTLPVGDDEDPEKCAGDEDCTATEHVHGCFADKDCTSCDELAADSAEAIDAADDYAADVPDLPDEDSPEPTSERHLAPVPADPFTPFTP